MDDLRHNSSGISYGIVLTVLFMVLKLTRVISWSWLWVLSPLWISAGITIVVSTCIAIYTYCTRVKIQRK
jgi:hypothetical protein